LIARLVAVGLCILLGGCSGPQQSVEPAERDTAAADNASPVPLPPTTNTFDAAGDSAQPAQEAAKQESVAATPSAEKPGDASGPAKGTELTLGEFRFTVPEGWGRQKPRVDFILAEFSLPRAEGDAADGRLTVSVTDAGVKQTLAMWRDQFGGKPEKESQENPDIPDIWVTLVDFSGTYRARQDPSAPLEKHPGCRMFGAICDGGGQLHFIKAYGPAKTMAAHADEIRALVMSIRPAK
jgi:hypothetical protein